MLLGSVTKQQKFTDDHREWVWQLSWVTPGGHGSFVLSLINFAKGQNKKKTRNVSNVSRDKVYFVLPF